MNERIFPIYRYLRRHNKKVILGGYCMNYYWTKTDAKRIPEFTEHVLEYYEKWQNDELMRGK